MAEEIAKASNKKNNTPIKPVAIPRVYRCPSCHYLIAEDKFDTRSNAYRRPKCQFKRPIRLWGTWQMLVGCYAH
jgi:hypothetical protein